jgi:protein-S-isoprenylcysteine O-methyltransferase Ste14
MNTNKLILRYALRETLGLVVMGAALFWSAGRIDWWQGWAALVVMAGWTLGMGFVIIRNNPALLAERLGPRKGTKSWDTTIMSLLGLLQLGRYIVAGLDKRYSWTGDMLLTAQVVAFVLGALGNAVVVWATASNAFFSQINRIQVERGHAVATGGPYRYVRHPAYSGAIVFELSVPILLGSWWAMAFSLVTTVLLILRTSLEDRTLQAELPGYADFASRVRYRLLPGIW